MVEAAQSWLGDDLERFGDALAAVDDRGDAVSYAELARRADALGALIGPERRLLLVEGGNTVAWLVAYVAGLRGRHPMLVAPAGAAETMAALEERFRPALRLPAATGHAPVAVPGRGDMAMHPDLAVLLSTSGSTGSTKCVRLSGRNIAANAASIADYLDLGPDERGAANLPTHYSYGLSIVNSHLHVGAAVLLTGRSVVDGAFWSFLRDHGATSFAGVPHVYELLDRIDLAGSAPDTLRYFTQAGGRLPPAAALRYGAVAERFGARFYVMYGQTEATARMAYLPPDRLADHPDCIGVAIPGGRFSLSSPDGAEIAAAEVDGELIYHGPNVMMGYAADADALAAGPGPDRLATGDIACRTADGLFRITGRQSRFVKIFGNRLGLDDIERLLGDADNPVIATGVDDRLLVVTRDAGAAPAIAALLTRRLKLPPAYFEVRAVDEYPLLASGKVDYAALKASIAVPQAGPAAWRRPARRLVPTSVPAIFVATFGDAAREESATFNSLGGDSLNYVLIATELEDLIPQLPDDWETRSIGALAALSVPGGAVRGTPRLPVGVDTLRGVACLLVVAYHVIGYNAATGLRLPSTSGWHHAVSSFDYIRMPMFTALAGLIYAAMPVSRGRYAPFIARKARQLVVPLIFVTLIMWLMRQLAYGRHDSLLLAYRNGYQHLWYLDALMLMFAIVGLGDAYAGRSWRGWGVALVALILVRPWLPRVDLFAFTYMLHLLPFFIMGVVLYRAPLFLRSNAVLAIAVLVAMGLLMLQQATMSGLIAIGGAWTYLEYACGGAVIIAGLRLLPPLKPLERLAAYSYSIYLWHPAANAIARTVLVAVGIRANWALFAVGMLAGTTAPIVLHLLMLRLPRVSLPFVGR